MEPQEFPQQQSFEQKRRPGALGRPPHAGNGANRSQDRKYQIQNLWDRHHIMKRMALTGASHKQIAQALGCTEASVSNCLNSAIMQNELQIARGALDKEAFDVAKEIQRLHPKALAVLEEILDDGNAPISIRAKVAMDNLSRGGYSPVVRGSLDINHTFSKEELEQIKRDAIAAGARTGDIVETEWSIKDEDTNVGDPN